MANVICGQLDISQIGDEEIVAATGYGAWVGFEVEEKIYELQGHPYAYAVIKFNSPCWSSPCSGDSSNLVNQSFLMISNALSNTILKSGSQNAGVSDFFGGSGQIASTICGVDINLLKIAQENVDSLQSNEKGFQPAAVKPNACVVPIRSNVFSYGPWASANFNTTYGGAELQVNNDLAPWLFGSTSIMNLAAQELANTSVIGLSYSERGSATVVGLPMYTAGTALSSGPVLTNVSVSFGSNGATTTYDFATFTPKFGQLSRAIIERYKTITANRNEQLRFLRQNAINNNKIGSKFAGVPTATNFNTYNRGSESSKSLSDKNSLGRLLVGEIFDYQDTANSGVGQRTVVGLTTLSKSVLEMRGSGYKNKGFMSLDGLYGPVSISGDGELPRFVKLPEYTGIPSGTAWSVSPQPPVLTGTVSAAELSNELATLINTNSNIISIHKNYLNPLANPSAIPYHSGDNAGHSIEMVGRGTGVPNSGLMTNFYRPESSWKYSDDYRFLGMRGPLVLHSWGYDTEGRPVPNASDIEGDAKSGIFKTDNLKNQFLEDWLQKPNTWPVAPIDLRLDRERGVWVSPKEHKIVAVELLEDLEPYKCAKAKIINSTSGVKYGKDIVDDDGNIITSLNIIVEDRLGGTTRSAGDRGYASFDTFTSTYLLMGGGVGGGIKFAFATGPWPINSPKMIVEGEWSESYNQWYPGTGILYAYNGLTNISRTDEYLIAITMVGDKYIYVNGGSC